MRNNNSQEDIAVAKANERLARMKSAIGSNELSGVRIRSLQGKNLLEKMLADTVADDFDVAETRERLSKSLSGLK